MTFEYPELHRLLIFPLDGSSSSTFLNAFGLPSSVYFSKHALDLDVSSTQPLRFAINEKLANVYSRENRIFILFTEVKLFTKKPALRTFQRETEDYQ